MAHELRGLDHLAEDWSSVPHPQVGWLTKAFNYSFRGSDALSGFHWHMCTHREKYTYA